ncbi:MAG TPA: protein-disulfide reductase DsbD N-terminal domain-containing protein, partial [Casimicrobiaceae bacterium]
MVFLATSTGSPPKRRSPERRICGRSPRFGWAALAFATSLVPVSCLAATEADLLPNERAFAFMARGLDERTVEARFVIADGYYLYREKLRFALAPGQIGAISLPAGKIKEDEFFGKMETYRNQLVVRLPLAAVAPGQSVTVDVESQGCADIGVCYPPQIQKVTVVLP